MRCDDLQVLLAGLVADDLSPAQEEFVNLHLQACPRCQPAYAALRQTQRQLSRLDADYRPELTERITETLQLHRTRRSIVGFLGRSLRAVGALAAVALVVAAVIWQKGPLQRPAAPPSASSVYLLSGDQLLRVDRLGQSARVIDEVEPGSHFLDGGLLWSGKGIYRLSAEPDRKPEPWVTLPTGRPDSLFLSAGSVHRLIAHESRESALGGSTGWFKVINIDPETGLADGDSIPREGHAYDGVISPDGRTLYLLAEVGGNWFVKEIETAGNSLTQAHLLSSREFGGIPRRSSLVLSPAGDQLHVVGMHRLLTIDLATSRVLLDQELEVSRIAALSPAGDQLLAVRPIGGLTLVDLKTGESLKELDGDLGENYWELLWQGSWAYGLRRGAIDLIDPVRLEVVATTTLSEQTGQIMLP